MDWNNDGKHDWTDDALFHAIIDGDGSNQRTSLPSGCSTIIIMVFGIGLLFLKVLSSFL